MPNGAFLTTDINSEYVICHFRFAIDCSTGFSERQASGGGLDDFSGSHPFGDIFTHVRVDIPIFFSIRKLYWPVFRALKHNGNDIPPSLMVDLSAFPREQGLGGYLTDTLSFPMPPELSPPCCGQGKHC
uniref:Uncharacterized protein n=1 Tax=Oryza nivara TaxID=4536 RepID=A0A0E0HYA6_ORYNI